MITSYPRSDVVYDSDQRPRPVVSVFTNLWNHRALLRLLVVRDLTVRYKRSALGVSWTLLNPVLTMAVMWVVFGAIFRFATPDGEPYVVYLLSGLLIGNYFGQAVVAGGSSIVGSAGILAKVYVPAEVFSISTAAAAGANFFLSLVPLLLIQVFTGVGIPWTVFLVPIPAIALLALVAGLGMLVAAAAVHFYDVIDLTGVLAQLITFLTPTFYPIDIIPEHFHPFIYANPLYHYLLVFRGFAYRGEFAPWWAFTVMGVTSVVVLSLGVWVFSRSWKSMVVDL